MHGDKALRSGLLGCLFALSACASNSSGQEGAHGGAPATSTGGAASGLGGVGNGGSVVAQGGGPLSGGSPSSGSTSGGVATGGVANGGIANGGTTSGGSGGAAGAVGGTGTGGVTQGGESTAGAAGGLAGGSAGQPSSGGASGGTASVAGASSGGNGGGTPATSGGTTGCVGLVCEDFESGKVDASRWDLVAKSGTFSVQQQRVAHGQYAGQLHGQAGSADDWALLVAKNVPAALKSSTTFGRLYFYWATEATASIHIQMAFAGHTGTGSANGPAPFTKLRYMEVASYGGRWQLGFDLLDVSPLVEEVSYSDGRIPTNTWACLEWKFEDQPDRVTTWVDGAQVSTFDNTNVDYASPGPVPPSGGALYDGKSSELIGGFDTFGFGFHDWHPQKAFDVYYDDVVFDSKRVGCSSP